MSKAVTIAEEHWQATVIEYARLSGWLVAHFHDSRRQVANGKLVGDADARGFPDLVMVRANTIFFVELKGEKGRLTKAQEEWGNTLKACSSAEYRLWRPSDWPNVEETLR